MRVFLLDLWLDLREKRLAPVAIILLAGIIAVPIVLAKGTTQAPPPATGTTPTTANAAPVIQSNPEGGPVESKLQTFSPRDPFEPTTKVLATTGATGGSTSAGSTPAGATTGETPGVTTVPGNEGGGTTGTPGTTGNGTGSTGTTTPERKTTLFTYTVDLRFGPPGDEKLRKGVQRLQLIPAKDPKIVFLGVTTTGKTAVFLIDNSLGVDTNGKCKPSADECTFLYLRPDDEHSQAELTDQDGNTFRVHLLNIHRVTVSSSSGGGNSNSGRSGTGNRSPAFTGSADSKKDQSASDPGEAPPGEPDQPFTYSGFFGDEGQ